MKALRIGIIGSGNMASHRAQSMAGSGGYELAAVAARNLETGRALAEKHQARLTDDWRSLVEDPELDAVVVTTHNALHGAISIAALENGKHVLSEYPACRTIDEAIRLRDIVSSSDCVYQLTHREAVSRRHAHLKGLVTERGELMAALFRRLTPGRGARPEVLFNLQLSGPPALFFVYHVYPLVDLFGTAAWVESEASYKDLDEDQGYRSFVNSVSAGFASGGFANWIWAGGIEITSAEESLELVMQNGVLRRDASGWKDGVAEGRPLGFPDEIDLEATLESRFLETVTNNPSHDWGLEANRALDATLVGLAAEISVRENRRIELSKLLG